MNNWFFVRDALPVDPVTDEEEYNVTLSSGDVTTLFYIGNGRWEDLTDNTDYDVVAWALLPEAAIPPKKYRYRLNPPGYGELREVYLTAAGLALTVAEWDIPVCKDSYKNIFTEKEYGYLSDHWGFDYDLFMAEDIPGEDQ